MRDIEKQILYNKFLHGDIKLQDITPGDLKSLTKYWLDDKYASRPSMEDQTVFVDELRRRDVEAATKPLRPIDREFFG